MAQQIALSHVSFAYTPSQMILQDINMVIAPGSLVGIVGPNGCGKTTLARLLNGNLFPTSGTVQIDGLSPDHHLLEVKRLVTLIQADAENQLITPTVLDEITFALQALGLDKHDIQQKAEAALEQFGLGCYRDVHPFYLSVGEQFRLLVAAAVVRQPRYLVLDEVLSMLDSPTRQIFLQMLLDLRDSLGLGIVILTHRLEDLLNTDQVIVLNAGRIAAQRTITELFSQGTTLEDWNIEIPLSYQVYALLPSHLREFFGEFTRTVPGSRRG